MFEGRDAAGEGGTIQRFTEHSTRAALDKPTATETVQRYFQHYVTRVWTQSSNCQSRQ